MSKLNQYFLNLFLLLTVSVLFSCSKEARYKIKSGSQVSQGSLPKNPRVTLYLDASVSMKGYVHVNDSGNYLIKKLLPSLVRSFNDPGINLKTYKIANNKVENIPLTNFTSSLQDGTIFNGTSTPLDSIFSNIIDTLKQNDLCFLVTDGILDFADKNLNNATEAENIFNIISDKLKRKNNSYAVFQYYSDFNGDHYFDYKNTGGRNMSIRPYHDRIMHKRPLYIWALGNKEMIKDLFENKSLGGYSNVETFNLNYTELTPVILDDLSEGSFVSESENSLITFRKIEGNKEGNGNYSITLGFDMNKVPEHYKSVSFLEKNLKFEQGLLCEFKVFDQTTIKNQDGYNAEQKEILDKKLDTFIKIIIKEGLASPFDSYNLFLLKPKFIWVDDSNIPNDFNIPLKNMEGKTFKLSTLLSPFYEKYSSDTLFSTVFEKIQIK